MKKIISDRNDVVLLVDTFYAKVKKNTLLAPVFNDVAKINWEHHLPIMYSFWAGILLGENTYKGNAMTPHIELSKKTPITDEHFKEWLRLFRETVNELFTGEKADEALTRAENIAGLMLYKINKEEKPK